MATKEPKRTNFNLSVLLNGGSTGLNVVLLFLEAGIASRNVTETNNGIFFSIVAINSFFLVFADLGIKQGVTQRIAATQDTGKDTLTNSVINFRLLTTTIVALFLWVSRSFIAGFEGFEELNDYLPYVIIMLFATSMDELMFSLLRGFQIHTTLSALQIVKGIARVLTTVLLVMVFNFELVGLIISWAVSYGVPSIMAYFILPFKKSPRIHIPTMVELMKFCRPLIWVRVVAFLRQSASNLIMLQLLGPAAVAAYSFAFKIPSGVQSLTEAYNNVFYPRITELRAKREYEKADILLNGSLAMLGFAVGGIALVGFLFGSEIMTLFWSETYANTGPLFGIILVGLQVQVVNTFLGYALVGAGHPKANSMALVISTPFMLVLNFILIIIFPNGLFGPAVGTIMEGTSLNFVFMWLARRYRYVLNYWHYFSSSILMVGGIAVSFILEWMLGISDQPDKTWPLNFVIMLIYFIGFLQVGALKMWYSSRELYFVGPVSR